MISKAEELAAALNAARTAQALVDSQAQAREQREALALSAIDPIAQKLCNSPSIGWDEVLGYILIRMNDADDVTTSVRSNTNGKVYASIGSETVGEWYQIYSQALMLNQPDAIERVLKPLRFKARATVTSRGYASVTFFQIEERNVKTGTLKTEADKRNDLMAQLLNIKKGK